MIIVLCQNPEPEFRGDKQENYLKNTNYITFFFKGKLATQQKIVAFLMTSRACLH